MRGAMCVIVRDLIVYGVLTDMMRGRPAVYATFSSYDEVAHHSGLERVDTLEALRKLDQQFGRIDRARRYAPRPYEIVVLSDHGQTQGATFKQRNGYGLDELVERSLEHGTVKEVAGGDEQNAMVGLAVGEATGKSSRDGKRAKNDVSDRNVVVLGSGNLGLISLMEEPRRLTLEEIDERHPRLIPALRAHPHVGWLLVRSSERGPVALGANGAHYLAEGTVEGEDPLAPFSPNAPSPSAAHGRVRARGGHHGRQLLRPRARRGLRLRGADLVPRRARRASDAGRSSSIPPASRSPTSRSSAPSRFTACSPAGGSRSKAATDRRTALSMNIVWAALVIAATTALAVAAMLLVRRGAPEGSRFADGDRASGVFGVLATGFSVLLGFIVFLAFESYDQSRSGAETEALVLAQQVETAQFLGPPVAARAHGRADLLRQIGGSPRVAARGVGNLGDEINPWGVELFRHPPDGSAADAGAGGGLRKMARPDLRPRSGPDRSDPRRGRRHPDAAVAGSDPHLRSSSSSSCCSSQTAARARSPRRC